MKSKMINRIISVITIFILIFILMLFMEKSHNYLIYVLSTLSGLFVIQILFNDYISVQKLGLGKTRKEIRRSVNRKYLCNRKPGRHSKSFLCFGTSSSSFKFSVLAVPPDIRAAGS